MKIEIIEDDYHKKLKKMEDDYYDDIFTVLFFLFLIVCLFIY
jgi:hypothetical protein